MKRFYEMHGSEILMNILLFMQVFNIKNRKLRNMEIRFYN